MVFNILRIDADTDAGLDVVHQVRKILLGKELSSLEVHSLGVRSCAGSRAVRASKVEEMQYLLRLQSEREGHCDGGDVILERGRRFGAAGLTVGRRGSYLCAYFSRTASRRRNDRHCRA